MQKIFLVTIISFFCFNAFAQWKITDNKLFTTRNVYIGDSIFNGFPKVFVNNVYNDYGSAGYGIYTKHRSNNSILSIDAISSFGYSSIWSSQAQGAGITTWVNLKTDNANEMNSHSGGGIFRLNLTDYEPADENFFTHYLAGSYSILSGNITKYPAQSIISAFIAEDQINSDSSYAGYFAGKTYFNQNVGIGEKRPQEKLEVNGNIRVHNSENGIILKSPDGTNWLITVNNDGSLNSSKYIVQNNTSQKADIVKNGRKISVILLTPEITNVDIELYNELGKMVFMKNYSTRDITINMKDYEKGVYEIVVKDSAGNVLRRGTFKI